MCNSWKTFDYKKWQELDEQFDHDEFDQKASKFIDAVFKEEHHGIEFPERPPWKPTAWYNPHGNMIECYISEAPSRTRWLNPQLEIMLSEDSDEIVGFTIHGITRMIEDPNHHSS